MEAEPSDFVCTGCNLRFKNAGTFERHKRKFCQQEKRKNSRGNYVSWSPTNGSRQKGNVSSGWKEFQQPANGDFWAGRSNSSARSSQYDNNRQRAFSHGEQRLADRYDGFRYPSMNSRFISERDELLEEQDRLEQHKRAIQEKLSSINRKRASTISTPASNYRTNEERLQGDRRSTAEKIHELHQHMGRQRLDKRVGSLKDKRNFTTSDVNQGSRYLMHINQLKQDYIQEGGNDLNILSMLHNLQAEASKAEPDVGVDENTLVQQLRNQLIMYQNTNISLLKKLQSRNGMRDTRHDQRQYPTQLQEKSLVRHELENLHDQRLLEMKQETEVYRQQLELERLRTELNSLRAGIPRLQALPPLPQPQQNQEPNHVIVQEKPMTKIQNGIDLSEEAFQRSPYDPGNGFALFWDFICNMPTSSERCRIAVTIYKDGLPASDVTFLPTVPCSSHSHDIRMPVGKDLNCMAILGVKQIFPRIHPVQSLLIAVQVQAGSKYEMSFESMLEVGWSNLEIFDGLNRVISGRWKMPIREPPLVPGLSPADANTIEQSGGCEIFYRLINTRDVDSQEAIVLQAQQTKLYKYPPLEIPAQHATILPREPRRIFISREETKIDKPTKEPERKKSFLPPPIPITPPTPIEDPAPYVPVKQASPVPVPKQITPIPVQEPSPPPIASKPSTPNAKKTELVGFQFDKIYDYRETTVCIKVSLYGSDGKVLITGQSIASKRTQYCQSPFLKSVLALALEEVQFNDVSLSPNSFAVIEVYTPASRGYMDLKLQEESDDKLVSWTAFRLCALPEKMEQMPKVSQSSQGSDMGEEEDIANLDTGRHELPLYPAPLPEIRLIRACIKHQKGLHGWDALEKSYLDLFIFSAIVVPPALPSDVKLYEDEENFPEGVWVAGIGRPAPKSVYKNGDGFEVYIDEAKFLPDTCSFTKVICSLYDSKFTKLKEEFESDANLDLSPHSPDFSLKFEFRDFSYPQTTTIFIKVYTVETLTRRVYCLGMAILPVFVKLGTRDRADDSDSKYCLNEGSYQLKLYNQMKNSDRLIRSSLDSPILCASLLVRLLPAPCHADGQPKQAFEFLEDQWESEGLLVPKPSYSSGEYESTECTPNVMECRLFHAYVKRKSTSVREILKVLFEGKKSRNDQAMTDTIKTLLKNLQNAPSADISYLAKYNSMHGLVFSLDSAQNLPWSGFTFATYCFSPPASFYRGRFDDSAVLVTKLDLDGLIRQPKWNDDLKVFSRRSSHANLTMIVQLYQVVSVANGDRPAYKFGSKAWTVIPLCNCDYPNHGYFQVGIFHDEPTNLSLDLLAKEPLIQTIANLRKKKTVKIVDGASIFVRMGDARRREELASVTKLPVRRTFLPRGNKFISPIQSKRFASIIPPNQNPEEFGQVLATKFKMLAGQAFTQRLKQ